MSSKNRKGLGILLSLIMILLLALAACGTATDATPTTGVVLGPPAPPTNTSNPASAFEPIGNNVTVMVPAGRTVWKAFTITSLKSGNYDFDLNDLKGIHIPTSSGYASQGEPVDIAVEVYEEVPLGTYYGQVHLKDDDGVEQVFTLTIKVVSKCDFVVPPQNGIPETFVTLQPNEVIDLPIGTARVHAECINEDSYPVYTTAVPDNDCLVETIQYSTDGTWGCYTSGGFWTAIMGGHWVMPYGQPSGWVPPETNIELMFPPDLWFTPTPPPPSGPNA